MEYVGQSLVRLKKDKDSVLRAKMQTSTEIVRGGVRLASALWSKNVSGTLDALKDLRGAYKKYKDSKLQPWLVLQVVSLGTAVAFICFGLRFEMRRAK